MPISTDLYTPGQSWIHQLDPRVKLLFVGCFLIWMIICKNLILMALTLVLLHLLHRLAHTAWQKLAFIWKTLWPVALLMALLWIVFYPTGPPLVQIWLVDVTILAIAQGLVLGLRILNMALAVFLWLYTTDQPSLVQSLVKLKLPYEWGLVLALALRYIPTFQGTYHMIADAQQARGLDLSSGTGYRRVRLMMPIFVAMIITALRASDHLSHALEARAFGAPGVRRTSLYELRYQPFDYLITGLVALTLIGLLYLNGVYGFGAQPLRLFS